MVSESERCKRVAGRKFVPVGTARALSGPADPRRGGCARLRPWGRVSTNWFQHISKVHVPVR